MKYTFDADSTAKIAIEWIKKWFEKNGPDCNAIIGISGGKDSTVVAKLCVEALGKGRVIGVLMPNYNLNDTHNIADIINHQLIGDEYYYGACTEFSKTSKEIDSFISTLKSVNDGYKVCKYLDIRHFCLNIYESVQNILNHLDSHVNISDQTRINLPPRIRMSTLYAIAQSMNGRVACTTNFSESYLGYGTRWGDTVGDFAPLLELTCNEVKAIGTALGIPAEFINRTPDDGLCGKSDEENFGFSYAELDNYIRNDDTSSACSIIEKMHNNSEFKRNPIAKFDPSKYIMD